MKEYGADGKSKLAVLWTTADNEAAEFMVFMYTKNAKKKGWFDVVRLIVWGPSARELAENPELQGMIREMMDLGVEVAACRACAERYSVVDALETLGIEVLYIGEPFSDMIKADWKVLALQDAVKRGWNRAATCFRKTEDWSGRMAIIHRV